MLKSIYRYSSISLSISLSLSLDRLGSSASTVSYLLYDQCHLCYYRHYSFIALSYLLRTQTNFLLKVIQSIGCSGPRYGQWTTLDPTFHSMGQKFTSRQRWTPSQTQLQILEKLFQQGNGTPSKQRIKEISVELSQYGQISETNVYNWFQNRKARAKRKQQHKEGESEVEPEEMDVVRKDKRAASDSMMFHQDQSNEYGRSIGSYTSSSLIRNDSLTGSIIRNDLLTHASGSSHMVTENGAEDSNMKSRDDPALYGEGLLLQRSK